MTHLQRRHLIRSTMRGALIALIALLLDARGYTTRLEHAFADLRVAHCQRYRPVPTDKLMHLDIDETALEWMGAWPWPREMEAQLLDEIKIAHPKVVTMDILFGEPTRPPTGQGGAAGGVSPDEQLAAAVKRLGCVLLPLSARFESDRPEGPYDKRLLELLVHDPQATEAACQQQLGVDVSGSPSLKSDFNNAFLSLRPIAIFQRIEAELDRDPAIDFDKVEQLLAPAAGASGAGTVVRLLVQEEFDRAQRVREMRRFSLPNTAQPLPVLHAVKEITPLLPLCRAAAFGGFADYLPEKVEGAVRSVPLLIEDHGKLVPQMALATACAALDVDVKTLKISPEAIIIPRPGKDDIRIPVSHRETEALGTAGMLMEVPIFGPKDNWLEMYNMGSETEPAKHVSIYKVYQAVLSQQRLSAKEKAIDPLVLDVLGLLQNGKRTAQYSALARKGVERAPEALQAADNLDKMIASLTARNDLEDEDKDLLKSLKPYQAPLRQLIKQAAALRAQLDGLRVELHDALGDRAVFIGGTATNNGDYKPTSLHFECPGVLIHGALFNAIMTGKIWRRSNPWLDCSLTLATGLLVMAFVTLLTPMRAFLATLLFVGGYLLINGYVLFDKGNLIVDAAGPTVAGLLVWGGLTLTNFITEKRERARIERRFRSYVDPSLVNFVLQHPEQSRLDGQTREMSMGFTDLEGFTAMTEKLKEKTIPLLAEYMGEMIPVIRAHHGFVSKLMGDGIFFFYGAPEPNPNHAMDAVNTMLDMRKALSAFNVRLVQRGMPALEMRAGVNTGMVIVGDAGTPDASDYTAMGEATNLASRLESGNKPFGTHSMITARTLQLVGDAFLVRPIAKLQVVGTTEGVQVYEPLVRREEATDRQRTIAEITTAAIRAFQESRFADCLAQFSKLETIIGTDKLILFYRKLCDRHMQNPPQNFSGQVVLNEK